MGRVGGAEPRPRRSVRRRRRWSAAAELLAGAADARLAAELLRGDGADAAGLVALRAFDASGRPAGGPRAAAQTPLERLGGAEGAVRFAFRNALPAVLRVPGGAFSRAGLEASAPKLFVFAAAGAVADAAATRLAAALENGELRAKGVLALLVAVEERDGRFDRQLLTLGLAAIELDDAQDALAKGHVVWTAVDAKASVKAPVESAAPEGITERALSRFVAPFIMQIPQALVRASSRPSPRGPRGSRLTVSRAPRRDRAPLRVPEDGEL